LKRKTQRKDIRESLRFGLGDLFVARSIRDKWLGNLRRFGLESDATLTAADFVRSGL
jgi:hypothetical protein